MLNNVAEEEEDEQRRSTMQNGLEQENEEIFDNFSTHEVEDEKDSSENKEDKFEAFVEKKDVDDELAAAGEDQV